MPMLKLDATRLDRAGAAVYQAIKGHQVVAEVPWSELTRRAGWSTEAFVERNHCLELARKALEAYADRGGARWLR